VPVADSRIKAITDAWLHWQHEGNNHGKPFDVYLTEYAEAVQPLVAKIEAAKAKVESLQKKIGESTSEPQKKVLQKQLEQAQSQVTAATKAREAITDENREWFLQIYEKPEALRSFKNIVSYHHPAGMRANHVQYEHIWGTPAEQQDLLASYNQELSGKILIPQPFGRLRNLYEAESGFCISKYMVIELLVGCIMFLLFTWVAEKVRDGAAPKGKLWNFLEAMLVFVKKDIAEKAIDHHYAHKYLPFLWTAFFFVLGCNLMGMLPWLGSPTASFGVTTALAFSTLLVVVVWAGMKKWGFFGFFKNLVPTIDLPGYLLPLKIAIVVMLFFIELLGLLIKHLVLAIRLLANMVAGHLVLVSILFIAFELHNVQQMTGGSWYIAAPISILGVTALSLLELFVAFLQAYVFTFLSALFIDSVLHHH
jgi:F-type H+-transporting ATPase subunit a